MRELTVGGRYAAQAVAGPVAEVQQATRGVPEPGDGAPVHEGLKGIAQDFGAVRDIAASSPLSRDERVRIRDEIATTSAHVARVAAGTATRFRLTRAQVEAYDRAAAALETSRSKNFPRPVGDAGLAGVPGRTDLERSLSDWVSASRAALRPDQMESIAPNARLIATQASIVSAACQRAALAQGGPDARTRADAWRTQAQAWRAAATSWRPPPRLVSGRGTPGGELHSADVRLQAVIAGEFRDMKGRWVPPERLADPATLRRFEFDARKALASLGTQYVETVGTAVRSERVFMPTAQLQRPVEGFSPATRLHQHRDWIPLRGEQPAARALIARGGEARRAAIEVERVSDASGRRQSSVAAAFPARGSGPGASVDPARLGRSFQQRQGRPTRGGEKGGPSL